MKSKFLCVILLLISVFACNRKQYSYKTPVPKPRVDSAVAITLPVDTIKHEKAEKYLPYKINPEIYYTDAFSELKQMVEGKQELSFKRAVFITENAYFKNELNYESYCNSISILSAIALNRSFTNKLTKYKFADSTNILMNSSIFYTLSDTTFILNNSVIANLPYMYDFNDCFAKEHWSNMFVTKLMATHKGNCHSLPFLYKIIAEELNAKVWLSFTPNHIYLRNWCKKIGWYNTELTSAQFPSEGWLMTSGYVSLKSIQSGLYMDTLSLKQSIAVCLNDLAKGYQRKFKNPDLQFILNCCELGLKYYPNYGELLLLKAETLKKVYEACIGRFGLNAQNNTEPYSEKIHYTLSEMDSTYDLLAKLDYREIPEEMFLEWIKSLNNNAEKYEDKRINDIFKTANK